MPVGDGAYVNVRGEKKPITFEDKPDQRARATASTRRTMRERMIPRCGCGGSHLVIDGKCKRCRDEATA